MSYEEEDEDSSESSTFGFLFYYPSINQCYVLEMPECK